ncbi:MAG TPA: GNAT family N-acetyltransferase [Nakamurella sp.]
MASTSDSVNSTTVKSTTVTGSTVNNSTWDVRPLAEGDLPELIQLDAAAFHIDPPADFLTDIVLPMLEIPRLTGARERATGGALVGTAAILSKRMTFPGGRVHPVAAVTYVAVRAGWRRRGLLTAMMRDQLHGLHESGGEATAILTASEGAIYGRYGYGRAIDCAQIRLPHGADFSPAAATESVCEVDAVSAAALAHDLWDRMAPNTTGHLTRTEADWRARFAEHDFMRRGNSTRRWAAHQDGLVGYRVRPAWQDRDGSWPVIVTDLYAATPVAHASLWRFLLDLDLTDRVEFPLGWVDDPVQDLLADRRSLTLTLHDHVWLRLVDLDRAVELRGYSVPARVDMRVVDEFCPWNAGTWCLDLAPDSGQATRTSASPQLELHIRDLAACFLGGTPLARLAAGGQVTGDPDALRRLGLALSTSVAPWCPEGF